VTTFSPTLLYNAHGFDGHERDWGDPRPIKGMRTGGVNRTFLLSWPNIEWTEGKADWSAADILMQRHDEQGLRVLACMGGRDLPKPHWLPPVPPWALDRPDRFKLYGAHGAEALQRYPGRLIIEGVNEYDSGGCTPEDAGRYNRALHDAVHAVEPDAIVIAGNIQSIALTGHGLADLSTMLDSMGTEPDAIGLHVYVPTTPIEQIAECIHGARGVLRSKRYLNTRIRVTECGIEGFTTMAPAERGRQFRAVNRQCIAARVDGVDWHAFDDPSGYGLPAGEMRGFWNEQMRQIGANATAKDIKQ
jgi:hypothetical protein